MFIYSFGKWQTNTHKQGKYAQRWKVGRRVVEAAIMLVCPVSMGRSFLSLQADPCSSVTQSASDTL